MEEWGGGKSQEFNHELGECRTKLRRFRGRKDVVGIQTYNVVRWEFLNLLEKKEVYWKQRAKIFWLQHGDQNTRFFHIFASARKKNNAFQRIKNMAGEWVETEEEIQDVVINYFKNIFMSSCKKRKITDREIVKKVTEEENTELKSVISAEEVKSAVFSMYPEKSPGLDGLNPAFFQNYWGIVRGDVVKFFQQYISTGVLPREVNQTIVCLIPKIKMPQEMTDFCPISLCNTLVRIISKVLANRLKGCLNKLISDQQSAFIEGRLLNDNALIAFEVNHYMWHLSQGKNGIAGFKINISKLYDRLEWDFVRNMMSKFGFSELWTTRIMGLITSVSYSFI